jgi:DNA-binding transcriptional LysR family regulator
MNWEQVRFFYAVAETGTVSGAARLLSVSHATVLRNVARLEEHLTVRLFDHSPGGYRLTLAGQDILEDVRQMANGADALVQRLKDRDRTAAGALTVSLPERSIVNLLQVIGAFATAYPEIELSIGPGDVDDESVDVMFRITDQPPEDLIGRQLRRLDMAIYTTARHAQATPTTCPWIIWHNTLSANEALAHPERWLRRMTPEPRIVLNAQSHDRALDAVRASLGAALLFDTGAEDDLIRLDFPYRPVTQGLWMLTSADLRGSARVSTFMQFVVENQTRPAG